METKTKDFNQEHSGLSQDNAGISCPYSDHVIKQAQEIKEILAVYTPLPALTSGFKMSVFQLLVDECKSELNAIDKFKAAFVELVEYIKTLPDEMRIGLAAIDAVESTRIDLGFGQPIYELISTHEEIRDFLSIDGPDAIKKVFEASKGFVKD